MADGSVLELPETFCPSSSLPTMQLCGKIDCPAHWVLSNWTQVRNIYIYSFIEKLSSCSWSGFKILSTILLLFTFHAATGFMLFYCVFCVLNVTLKCSWQGYRLINCYAFRMTSLASPRLCYSYNKHRFLVYYAVFCHTHLTEKCLHVALQ